METTIDNFEEFGLAQELSQAVQDMGFIKPMPIQAMVIPALLAEDSDVVGLAQTGTGKTAAFGLPLLHRMHTSHEKVDGMPRALVIAPTRELCLQIASDLADFARYLPEVKILPVYGGSSIESQMRTLKNGVNVVVATPGRLLDLIKRGSANLSRVQTVVMDEADEMLNMGFIEDIEDILSHINSDHRTLMFSATMPPEIRKIATRFMQHPLEFVAGHRNETSANVRHIYYMVKADDKYLALKRIADYNPDIYGIVFCRTRLQTQEVADKLIADGYNADCLHGDLSQAQRDLAMKKFRDNVTQLLVATDVAARGLDVDNLTHVIHYTLPDDPAVYTHRSGRTGRAGKSGVSVAIIHSREQGRLRQIEKKTGCSFEHKLVPSPQRIIEKQLFTLADRIERTEADSTQLENFIPQVRKKLEWLSADDLLQRIFSLELNRLLAYYRGMPDIDLNSKKTSKEERQKNKGKRNKNTREAEPGYTRIFLNAGKIQGIMPTTLFELINGNLADGRHKPDIGRIDLMDDYSLFDVKERDAKIVIGALKNTDFFGYRLYAEEAKADKQYAAGKKSFGKGKNREAKPKREKKKNSARDEQAELLASLPPRQLKKLKQKGKVIMPETGNPYHGNFDIFIKKKKDKK